MQSKVGGNKQKYRLAQMLTEKKNYGKNLVLHLSPSFSFLPYSLSLSQQCFLWTECFTAAVGVIMMNLYGDSVGD